MGGQKVKMQCDSHESTSILLVLIVGLILLGFTFVTAAPEAPDITVYGNQTKPIASAAFLNTSGGSITTMLLNATTQNTRWKAYVGNITGKLTLMDASNYSLFDWGITTALTGEIYATRQSGSINWNTINCSSRMNVASEEIAMNHTSNPNDNISVTFSSTSHNSFFVGSIPITADSCYSLHTNVNGSAQSSDFSELLLHDSSSLIYTTLIENNKDGYRPGSQYDFQMIVPETGLSTWTSSTPYYFYVEII